jgi:hypothetical protein
MKIRWLILLFIWIVNVSFAEDRKDILRIGINGSCGQLPHFC